MEVPWPSDKGAGLVTKSVHISQRLLVVLETTSNVKTPVLRQHASFVGGLLRCPKRKKVLLVHHS